MVETRSQLKARLQDRGLWNDFVALRSQLTADGMTPAQAKAEALHRVEIQVAPPRPAKGAGDNLPPQKMDVTAAPEELPDFTRRVPNDRAVQWVAQNLCNTKLRPDEAPSGLAWGLLAWVRRSPGNEASFWGSIWPKVAAKDSQAQEETDNKDVGTERALEMLDKLITDLTANERPQGS